jgi:hypothetical protein
MNAIPFDVICRPEILLGPAFGSHRQTRSRKTNRKGRRWEFLCDNWDISLAADCIAKVADETGSAFLSCQVF